MINKKFINFLSLLLFTHHKKHLSIFVISVLLVSIMGAVLFISSSIQKDINATLDNQADITVQRYKGGKVLNTPEAWIDEFLNINGVASVQGRIYGVHYYEPSEQYFMIVGVDFFDTQIVKTVQTLSDNLDIKQFLQKDNMIIGSGVKEHFDKYAYYDYYPFRPPDRSIKKVNIYDTFSKESDIVSSDMIIMDINLAREILGVEDGYVTDIIIKVPNPLELEMIKTKLVISHFDMRIIKKDDIQKYYKNLFNYKGGVFLTLYIVVVFTFLLILYQRYSMIRDIDSKEIAILRFVGWRIDTIVWLKISENFIVATSAYMLGILFAYFYVFVLDAPILKNIFLGYSNLENNISFSPNIDAGLLMILFLFFVLPFMIAIIIPVWRIAIVEPSEVMR